MSDQGPTPAQLEAEIARLTARVWTLEQTVAAIGAERAAPAPAHELPVYEPPPPAVEPPPAVAAPRPAAAQPRPVTPPAYTPPPSREPIDWGKVAARVFTARTLAWAGAVATVLGVVLLFVLAASRGWVTPPMRLGIGVVVSAALLGVSIELDRRSWRADAILAAAGAGIAGLYATLWAAAALYGYVGAAGASGLAAAIAALAVIVAIRFGQEPLAAFGVSAAMLAPVLVGAGGGSIAPTADDFTAYAVLYAAVMLGAALPLYVRFRWQYLVSSAWLIATAETGALLIHESGSIGFGAPVMATGVVVALFLCLLFLVELLRPVEGITPLGWLIAASSFTLSLAGTFLFAGSRTVDGHSLAGLTLLGVAAVWGGAAAVPYAVRRRHADLTDVLGAFSLTLIAAATGLLLGGAALPSVWSAQSALLVAAAERIARRSSVRQIRLTVAAGVYLVLATLSALAVVAPSPERLPNLGDGSWQGSLAIIALAAAGVVYAYGLRRIAGPERAAIWGLPAIALAYLPLWALDGTWATVALAAMAAALFAYRRSGWMISWLQDEAAIVIGCGWWLTGLIVAMRVVAPIRDLAQAGWVGVGAGNGLVPLAVLTASAGVLAWSVRRPARPEMEHALLLPVAMLAYLLAEALEPPYVMWAWLAMGAVLAGAVHVPALRRRLRHHPLLAASAGSLGLGLVAAWSYDQSLNAIAHHGTSAGWASILIACVGTGVFASALLDPTRRSYALWAPFLLAAQLACMLLPGQYPLVAIAAMSAGWSALELAWPRPVRSRLARQVIAEIAAVSALGITAVVLAAYETPQMLFRTGHTPASGLAAAVASTLALFAAAAAARDRSMRVRWLVGRFQAATLLVYLAGASALWTLSAAILGAEQLVADPGLAESVHDHFQQGQVLVSVGWVLVGLALVVASLRGERRALRAGGIALLFVALGKLFLYDLTFLTAMARAVSFIATGSVLLLAALLLQRFAPQVKAALGDEHPRPAG
ncbi:MAG TPA: DUF2339 domain-containing protein [Gaiellales bacterium]|nr:DUF2339 domain-containing protein [Gaiellales bacterium]